MKKPDMILIAVILAASAFVYCMYFVFHQAPADEMRVNMFVDGELVMAESLLDASSPLTIENAYGRNICTIEPDGVKVTWADCASQTCVHTGKISRSGEVIACLPHHLLITLEGSRNWEDIDAIAK